VAVRGLFGPCALRKRARATLCRHSGDVSFFHPGDTYRPTRLLKIDTDPAAAVGAPRMAIGPTAPQPPGIPSSPQSSMSPSRHEVVGHPLLGGLGHGVGKLKANGATAHRSSRGPRRGGARSWKRAIHRARHAEGSFRPIALAPSRHWVANPFAAPCWRAPCRHGERSASGRQNELDNIHERNWQRVLSGGIYRLQYP
jgi:hypothetical protein